jgi:hypothetical protein
LFKTSDYKIRRNKQSEKQSEVLVENQKMGKLTAQSNLGKQTAHTDF